MRVLFVCGDNLGRSQVAEALFNLHAKRSKAESCAGKPEVKERRLLVDVRHKSVEECLEIMKKDYGIDISRKVSKPFSAEMVNDADRVVILCSGSECPDVPGAEHWDIPKLSPLDLHGKQEVIKTIGTKVNELLNRIGD